MKKLMSTCLGTVAALGILGASVTVSAATNTTSKAKTTTSQTGAHHGPGGHGGFGAMGSMFSDVAKDLKITTTTLQKDLKAGKTIASLAKTKGISSTKIISELESTMKASITKDATAGKITSAQEKKILANLNQQITDFVNGKMPQGGHKLHSAGGSTSKKTQASN